MKFRPSGVTRFDEITRQVCVQARRAYHAAHRYFVTNSNAWTRSAEVLVNADALFLMFYDLLYLLFIHSLCIKGHTGLHASSNNSSARTVNALMSPHDGGLLIVSSFVALRLVRWSEHT